MKPDGHKSASKRNTGPVKTRTGGSKKSQDIENFDLERMRVRLAGLGDEQEGTADTTSSTEIDTIWAQRALQMAAAASTEESSEQIELVVLRVGRELLGIEVNYISAIRQNEPITRVPRVPAWVAGVVNLRGSILSVIDLRVFLGLPTAPVEEHTIEHSTENKSGLLVVTATRDMQVVLLVDDVPGVEAQKVKDIRTETNILRGLRPEYVRGIVERRSSQNHEERAEQVIVLNIEALLSDRRMIIHDEPA